MNSPQENPSRFRVKARLMFIGFGYTRNEFLIPQQTMKTIRSNIFAFCVT
jgi:hypothetical protein